MATKNEVATFIALLKYFGIYQDEDKYKIVCPFHNDKNASLQINVSDAFFYCYADCGAKGGPLELYKQYYKLDHGKEPSDVRAMMAIKKITGNKLEEYKSDKVDQPKQLNYTECLAQARAFYYNLPDANWFRPSAVPTNEQEARECRDYMKGRGFTPKTLTRYCAKPTFNKYYPICFPLLENGKFRGYVMRTFDPDVEANRKYMYNRGFRRERTLAGEFGDDSYVVLVEGYLDKLKASQLGIQNVCAILGWKITSTQIKKLVDAGVDCIICALDNDEAGRKGYNYLKLIAKKYNFKLFRLRYPKGCKDMGDVTDATKTIVINQMERILDQL